VAVEATRQYLSERATAQAVAVQATATAVAVRSEGETLKLERQRELQAVKTWGWIALGLAVIMAFGAIGWRAAGVIEDRARLVRRGPDEGEPILILRTPGGDVAYRLPLRHPTSDSERLAGPEAQERAVMRQQTANALQARQAAKITAAKHNAGRRVVMLPSQNRTPREYEDPQLPPIKVRRPDDLGPLVKDVRRQLGDVIDGEVVENATQT
jgi:hypothetical protein